MEKFKFKPYNSSIDAGVFTMGNGYFESSGEADTRKQLSYPLSNIADYINDKMVPNVNEVKTTTDSLKNELDTCKNDVSLLNGRVDTVTSLPSGSTTGDAELADIRVGANGTTYPNAGGAVRGQISELKGDIVNVEKNVGYEHITIEEQSTGLINPQLDVVATTEWGFSKPILVKGGKKYYYYSNNYETVSAITWCASDGQRKQVLHLGVNGVNTIEFTPNENMYIVLCYQKSVSPSFVEITNVNDVIDKVKYKDTTINKLDPKKLQFGYLDNGNIVDTNPTTNWYTTDFIEVSVGENYIFSSNVDNTRTPMHLYFLTKYNKNKEFISSVTDQGTEYTVEPDVHYIRFCYGREQNEPMLEIGYSMSETFIPFSNTPIYVNHKPLVDYTWLLVGDSLTEKNYRATQSYYDFIADKTGINFINKGHSGLGYLKDHYFYNAISEVDDNKFNFCTFFGSGNDLSYETVWTDGRTWEQALGNVTDVHWQSICGCINMTINRFYELHPLKKLGIVTPTPWAEYANEDGTINGTRMDDYSNALIEICKMRGIPCLDLYHESGLRPWDNTFRTTYYNELGVQDDGVHPNSRGHKWIFRMFQDFIEKYLLDV